MKIARVTLAIDAAAVAGYATATLGIGLYDFRAALIVAGVGITTGSLLTAAAITRRAIKRRRRR